MNNTQTLREQCAPAFGFRCFMPRPGAHSCRTAISRQAGVKRRAVSKPPPRRRGSRLQPARRHRYATRRNCDATGQKKAEPLSCGVGHHEVALDLYINRQLRRTKHLALGNAKYGTRFCNLLYFSLSLTLALFTRGISCTKRFLNGEALLTHASFIGNTYYNRRRGEARVATVK